MSFKKVIFIVFNTIFFILGCAVLGVGIYTKVQDGNWKNLISTNAISLSANILITAGVFVAIVGFLGCFGAWKKNVCLIGSYAVFVLIIFILQLAAGIYAYTKKGKVQEELEKSVKKSVAKSYGGDKGLTKAVDWFQKNVKCCGSAKPDDWMTSAWYKALKSPKNTIVPESCCVNPAKGCNEGKTIAALGNKIYTTGCVEQGKNYVKKNLYLIGGVGIGIGVVELLGIVCAFLLIREIKECHTA